MAITDHLIFMREADERVAHLTPGECYAALATQETARAMCAALGLPAVGADHDRECKPLIPLPAGISVRDACIHGYTASALAKRALIVVRAMEGDVQ